MLHFDQAFLACGLFQNTVDNGQVIGMSAPADHRQRRYFAQGELVNPRGFV
ncbi:hypothetical protein D3C76_1835330 [compost metagenome]